ncbi:MAG: FAD-binding protein [Desulfobacterales bacterium]|nr:FAD-binding protein [Desulfobacterales bacterium]
MKAYQTIQTEVLVIGGGIAGIRAAMEAHDQGAKVFLANKSAFGRDGAAVWMAGWGFQAALYPPDSLDQHVADTVKGGWYLNNQELVRTFLSMAPKCLDELSKWGMRLGKDGDRFTHARLPGHSYARSIHHAHFGKMLGAEYKKVLPRQVRRRKGITVSEDLFVFDLLKTDGEAAGAMALDMVRGAPVAIEAKATILATGGYMACYPFTTANSTATGDGHAAAYRAGVQMTGMEFVQFIPTAAIWPDNVRGDLFTYSMLNLVYGMFFNKTGERFMERYYPKEKDWATREAASRAIAREVREGRGAPHGGVYLSFKHIPRNIMNRFLEENRESSFLQKLKEVGFDIREDALEVGPAAHYVQGGCWIDPACRTNLKRLYAAGEVGSGEKDGADRLAGNSLPFCMAMGEVAGRQAAADVASGSLPGFDPAQAEALTRKLSGYFNRTDGVQPFQIKERIQQTLGAHAVFEKDAAGLTAALKDLADIRENMLTRLCARAKATRFNLEWMEALEAENMTDVAEMVLRSALMRQESRGLHERRDFPQADPAWLKHIILEKKADEMSFSTRAVTFPYVQPKKEE